MKGRACLARTRIMHARGGFDRGAKNVIMFYYFYIKKISEGRYRMGVAPDFRTARSYGDRGRLVFTVRGWDAGIVLPYLRFAEEYLRNFKQGDEYSITSFKARQYLEEVKLHLKGKSITPAGVILYGLIQGFWWLGRGFAWAMLRLFVWDQYKRAAALYKWEEETPYPLPPKCKAHRDPYHFAGFVWPYWVRLGAWYVYMIFYYLLQALIFVFYQLPKKIANGSARNKEENFAGEEAAAAS